MLASGCLLRHSAALHYPPPDLPPAPLAWPQGAPAHGPCILTHPLENIQAVAMADAPLGGGAGWDEEEQVVWSGVEVPYLVTHSAVSVVCVLSGALKMGDWVLTWAAA